jgi:hypothetical protein
LLLKVFGWVIAQCEIEHKKSSDIVTNCDYWQMEVELELGESQDVASAAMEMEEYDTGDSLASTEG